MVESKRIRRFRLSIAKDIPKFPNDKASLLSLEAKPLTSLLIDYANWAIRYVTPRPRTVSIEPTAMVDPRWRILSKEINSFLEKVRRGEDLTPHLSLRPHTQGFTPTAAATGPNVDRWADKDQLLNIMGYHHFHLGLTLEPAGHTVRTDSVLFAAVTREQFEVVALFDHSVFERPRTPAEEMSPERERLWEIFDERSSRGLAPGSVYAPSMIATSGHPVYIVRLAQHYAHVIREIDPKLDDPSYVRGLYQEMGVSPPPKPKLRWYIQHLKLGLLDEAAGAFAVFLHGPN